MKFKMFWLITISLIILFGLTIWAIFQPEKLPLLNFLILGLTLVVLIGYAYDTHRIADQTLEANLRPVVLQSGYIPSWSSIQFTAPSSTIINGQPIQFAVLKNIAKDINGYIVLNNRKYTLLFGSPISQIPNTVISPSSTQQLIAFNSNWGWLSPGNVVLAIFNPTQFQQVNQDNEIYIQYKDIEGNEYFTQEDKNFSSTSGDL